MNKNFSFTFALFLFTLKVSAGVEDFTATPPLLSDTTTPMIMLAMPNDHQLYYKAYTDWDDLDNDDTIETTYTHSIDYAGYFDSYKCYTYGSGRFSPVGITANKYCNLSPASGQWSGNFLNWATMTRMDEIRKVLYGGFRSTDTGSITILERAFLPNDAHSFAKYYNGSDLYSLTPFTSATQSEINANTSTSGITICNTTDADRTSGQPRNSSLVDDPPLMKVVRGNYSLWAASERFQCTYNNDSRLDGNKGENGNTPSSLLRANSDSPNSSAQQYKLNVRVEVCNSSFLGQEDCKLYPNGNYKPVGLLQEFGDDDSVYFGLVSGSYQKNKDGGVLRKNVESISDEINIATNGTFTGANGIIKTLNTFRIAGYEYWNTGDDSRNGTYKEYDDCEWGRNSFSNGDCTNWGNPFAEIMLECYRYYAGKSANATFAATDSSVLSGLSSETFVDPLNDDNACAKLNVIAFNASSISYDRDNLALFSDLNPASGATAQTATKLVGDGEGITGNSYFVGESGGTGNQLCTAKTVNDLGTVEGTCPDAPRLDGSFMAAGLAHHAHVNDIRDDLDGDQLVTTYGVSLSPALPQIKIPVPGSTNKVTILPACHNDSIGGNCGLVDFKVLKPYTLVSAGTYTGTFYVNWEDSEQGGDYDQDMAGLLTYTITSSTIDITTKVVGQSTPNEMALGYILSGTTDDGFHAQSGINEYDRYDCNDCESSDAAATESYFIGSSTADLLEQPLFYAAKWGGFFDEGTVDATLGEPIPNLQLEWDVIINATGAYGSDGIPDNYYFAVNPAELKDQLEAVVRDILARTASGTAASVVTSTGAGEGALYQALYNPRYDTKSDSGNRNITWVGSLHGLFLDRFGELREDLVPSGESIGQLTDDDPIVTIYYNQSLGKTMFQRYAVDVNTGRRSTAMGSPLEIGELDPIWSAREQLGALTNLTSNRSSYSAVASGGRFIFTGIDDDTSGWIEQDEVVPFVATTFDKSGGTDNFRLLGFQDAAVDADVANLVNFIRGDETISGFRSRSIEYDGNLLNGPEPWLLGDIVHSSPTVLTKPTQGYDISFNDTTYANYRNAATDRRQVVFVGANDGMLHAFNSGFYDPSTKGYLTTNGTEVAHPLGSELWAYIPYNVLPHLQYLSDPSYPHVYYVDGQPQLYDVNDIWSAGSGITHTDGWGTILVVGMRFGGGEIQIDPDSDPDADASDDLTLRSSYIVMDVTDPEVPPEIIGEINHADLGYTVSHPTLIKHRSRNATTGAYASPASNNWYLVWGSGPTGTTAAARKNALDHAVSDKTAKVFIYDLKNRSLSVVDTGIANAFVGGVNAADWNRDYIDDAIYFGIVGGDEATPTGQLMRGVLNWTSSGALVAGSPMSISPLLDVNDQPFSAVPTVRKDSEGGFWVYSGTGRFYTVEDNLSTASQSYYGIKDPDAATMGGSTTVYASSELVNTTDIQVYADGTVLRSGSTTFSLNTGQVVDSYMDIRQAVAEEQGWYFDLPNTFERNVTKAAISDTSLVFTTYQPTGQACDSDGAGRLYAPHLLAGVPGPFAPLGTDSSSTSLSGAPLVYPAFPVGIGNPSDPTIYQDSDGKKKAIIQTSTGEIVDKHIDPEGGGGSSGSGNRRLRSWREVPINW